MQTLELSPEKLNTNSWCAFKLPSSLCGMCKQSRAATIIRFKNVHCWWVCASIDHLFYTSSQVVPSVYLDFFGWGRADRHQTSQATTDSHVAAQQRHSPEPRRPQEARTEYLQPAAQGPGTSGSQRSLYSHLLVLLSISYTDRWR